MERVESGRVTRTRWSQVEEAFVRQQERGAFPGGQLVVRHRGAVVVDVAVGVARGLRSSEGAPVSVTPATRFQVMSASKPVVAAVIALLEETGELRLDAPIAAYWPEFAAHGKGAITLDDVLTHRSGLLTPEIDSHPELWRDWGALTAALADVRPTYPRGTQAYNPLAYGWILAELVRRVTGLALPDLVRATFPAELQGLQFMLDPYGRAPVARTYWLGAARHRVGGLDIAPKFETVNNEVGGTKALVPGAAMYTDARTLSRFYEMILQGALPVSATTLSRYTSVRVSGWDRSIRAFVRLGRGFARGWRPPHLYGWWNTGACFGHAGGFSAVGWADERAQTAVALITNGNRSVGDLLRRCAPLGSAIRGAARATAASHRPLTASGAKALTSTQQRSA
jgi:CubicO group peptidase (beta-lactamase class C family)